MVDFPLIEIREPGRPVRRVVVNRAIEVGRDCDGELLDDDGVSRRHVKLVPSPLGLSIVDLGSRNGTLINGTTLESRAVLAPGDVVRLGHTEIVVVQPVLAATVPASRRTSLASAVELVIPAPPVLPPVVVPPSRLSTFAQWVMRGGEAPEGMPTFRNYMEFPRRVPLAFWHVVRVTSIVAYIALCVAMFIRPAGALFTFFKVIVPLLPILFFVAPGLWRNICPLAAANQTPRVLGFSRAGTAPDWLRKRSFIVASVLFFGIAGARLALFNNNASATGVLLSLTIINAFIAGLVFTGKSGWCSSMCPLLPLQRVYGQTPFVVVPNSHCNPCVSCTTNCFDFKPQPAFQADLHNPDPQWSGPRKLFASALPGFVLGFFTLVGRTGLSDVHVYERLALYVIVSIGSYFVVSAILPLTVAMVTAIYASAAINIFYWYASVTLAGSLGTIIGQHVAWVHWPIQIVVAVLTVIWISRTYWSERRYLVDTGVLPTMLKISAKTPSAAPAKSIPDAGEVRFLPDDTTVSVEIGASLLEVAEREGRSIEAGCRMGVCGADPVAVLNGMECLSAPDQEEQNTLRRLGLADSTRMACCARLQSGSVDVSLTPEPAPPGGAGARPARFDRSISSVVVIGNGIAGVTAADFVRRGHPDCEVHLVGLESHVLYNRMGISRLVYGRSAMTGLYLLGEQWYHGQRRDRLAEHDRHPDRS